MKILLTGANGFLGHYLTKQLLEVGATVIATGKGVCRLPFAGNENFFYTTLDFTNEEEVYKVIHTHKPEVLVHAGAMSKPDECELQKEEAWFVNVKSTSFLLAAAQTNNCRFVYISTDFVFDGTTGMYSETDIPNPVNYYGQTKLEAENLVQLYPHSWAIVRTVLVYGKPLSGRTNILTIVKDKLKAGETYKVVTDQVRTPTYVEDLVAGIIAVVIKSKTGIWHIAGEEIMTPYEMACAVANYLHLDKNLLQEATALSFRQPANRPAKTGFNITKAKSELSYNPTPFTKGLIKTFS